MKDHGQIDPQDRVPVTRDPSCCPGEAPLWQPGKNPVGTDMKGGKRGGLAGAIPEALCGDAPKGQPMIRREPLEADCVEAPKGQPRNHRRHPKRLVLRPTGERQERDPKTKDPQLSRLTRRGKREIGDHSPDPLRGERVATGGKWTRK